MRVFYICLKIGGREGKVGALILFVDITMDGCVGKDIFDLI